MAHDNGMVPRFGEIAGRDRSSFKRGLQAIQSTAIGRHVHARAYAALVLSGGYEEAGDSGRFGVEAGDVVLHERFEGHLNRAVRPGTLVLNLALPDEAAPSFSLGAIGDPDAIARAARRDEKKAAALLLEGVQSKSEAARDWPDELAAALCADPSLRLGAWSRKRGLSAWAVSRGFARVFAVTPQAFRARARARKALRDMRQTREPLAELAARLGFADQAHMTRAVKALSGAPPSAWRKPANGFKTA